MPSARSALLSSLVRELYGNEATQQNLTELGERLSAAVGRDKPFSYRHLNGVLKGHKGFNVSDELRRACEALAVSLDGQSPLMALINPEPVQVFGINGNLRRGAIVLGEAKPCRNCQVHFVGRSGNQVYCCRQCRETYYREVKE